MTADVLGGVWTYSLELCRALSASGVRVSLATMGGPVSRERVRELRELRNVQLYESSYRLEWMEDPWADVEAAGDWLLSLAARENPDLIHLNGYAHAAWDWKAPVVVVAHSCVLSWWHAVKKEPAPKSFDEYQRWVASGLRAADLVVAPSVAMLNEVERWYGKQAAGVVIPNGRNAKAFPRGAKHGFILSAGRLWDEGKNVTALVEAARKLAWPVYIAGETAGPASRLQESEAVTLLGRLPETAIAPWYSRAAIYAHPAKYEPFGLSVLEAAAAGCALVLSDISSLRENWDGAALFVCPEPKALERAITQLIDDPYRLRMLQSRAAERARRFSVTAMARKYLEAYGEAEVRFETRAATAQFRRAG